MPPTDEIEYEFGVAIPGRILPEAEGARTAIKRLPPPGPLDWAAIFGRKAPVVLELGCGNARYTIELGVTIVTIPSLGPVVGPTRVTDSPAESMPASGTGNVTVEPAITLAWIGSGLGD